MFFTILGAIAGFFVAGLIGDCLGVDFKSHFAFGGAFLLIAGMGVGAGIGLSYGTYLLTHGNHPFNKAVSLISQK